MAALRGSLGITEQRVHGAADGLVAQGKRATLETIREALGGGSFTHISPHFRSWKATQRPKLTSVEMELPDDLQKAHRQAAYAMWHEASRLAGDKIKHIEESAEERVKDAIADRDALEKEIARLEEDLAAQTTRGVKAEEERDALRETVNDLSIKLERVTTENKSCEARLHEYEAQTAEMKRELKEGAAEVDSLKGIASQQQALLAEAGERINGLTAANQELQERERVLLAQREVLEANHKEALSAASKASVLLEERTKALTRAEGVIVSQKDTLSKQEALLEERTKTLEKMEAKADKALEAKHEAEKQAAVLQGRLSGKG